MSKQLSMVNRLPKAVKQTAGRSLPAQVPAHIRVFGVDLDRKQRASIRQRLGVKLGKHAGIIERASIRVLDANGPRGGIDKICRIKVVLSGFPSVLYESQATALNDAINGALAGTRRAVGRSVQTQRTQALRTTVPDNARPVN